MGWIFAAVALVTFVWLMVRFPRFRIAMVIIGVVGGGAIYFFQMKESEREARSLSLIQPSQLLLRDVKLGSDYGMWKVFGIVQNQSAHTLSSFSLRITVRDCPEQVSCETIGQDVVNVYVTVPSRQLRTFDNHVHLSNMPKPQKPTWNYEVVSVRASTQ